MNVTALTNNIAASEIPPERLAGNSQLSEKQKIAEASRQFEAILLRQILESSQKTVINSKFADKSASADIYRGLVTEQLADSISKSGGFGLAQTFEQQLNHKVKAKTGADETASQSAQPTALRPTSSAVKISSAHDS